MADSDGNRPEPDDDKIDLSDPADLVRWREAFGGVTEEELRAAVGKAGTRADKVREALRARA